NRGSSGERAAGMVGLRVGHDSLSADERRVANRSSIRCSCWLTATLAALWTSWGCAGERPPENPPAHFDHTGILDGTLEGRDRIRDDRLGIPTDLILVGDNLVVSDAASEDRLPVFWAHPGAPRGSFGAKGEGPGEYKAAPFLFSSGESETSSFWTFEASRSRFVRYHLSPSGSAVDPIAAVPPPLRTERLMYEALLVDDTTWVGLGFLDSGRFARGVLNEAGFECVGPGLSTRFDEDEVLLQQFHKAKLASRPPEHDRLALATIRGSSLEIFTSEGERIWMGAGPYPFDPDFVLDTRSGRSVWRAGPANRYGFVDVFGTAQCFYALFSGRSEEALRDEAWLAEFVYTFRWDGTLVRIHRLDRPALAIAVDERRGEFLAVIFAPDPRVRAYSFAGGC
ncbi:MAG: BF3164 family lipoprotein, partial [Longimicrobiales bacterium]|nr:BF3164 family lipoprotein [Longimicrobiales bacterium]